MTTRKLVIFAALLAEAARDIYAETVAATGIDPLHDEDDEE
jgi:hypothetical protein